MTPDRLERIRRAVSYDPATGIFARPDGRRADRPAAKGYRCVTVCGQTFLAHRLAVLLVTGSLPKAVVSHDNGDPGDNRWNNLTDVTHSANMHNPGTEALNWTGFRGVNWTGYSYRGSIQLGGIRYQKAGFGTAEAAAEWVEARRAEYLTNLGSS